MSRGTASRGPRLAQGALLVALLGLAAWAARWQPGPWWPADPPVERWGLAGACVALFAAGCGALAWRRRRRVAVDAVDGAFVLVAWASQTGFAAELAGHSADALRQAGLAVRLLPLDRVDDAVLASTTRALFVVSTTGEGDPPDHAAAFVQDVMAAPPALPHLRYAVLALGDRHYARFCAFGQALDARLRAAGASPWFDRIDVDAGDAAALRHWQQNLAHVAGGALLPDWTPPRYGRWTLVERRELNPGSLGSPAFHVALVPEDPRDLDWQAGDVAEVGPCHSDEALAAWLQAAGVDGDAPVRTDAGEAPLRALLARSILPPPDALRPATAQALADALARLPHRDYSIASLPADGAVQLLVRQVRRGDGGLGLGSGWLTAHARAGDAIAMRVRRNPAFHAPADARPMLLVGNGSGIAGLRALLRARIAAGHHRNWLVFGERQRAVDFHYGAEIEAWHADGAIERLDLVFSRDPAPAGAPRHVQERLRECMPALRDWVDAGAAVYVCGSLAGMAPGVDAVLREALGEARVAALLAEGRYRRDVY